MNVTVYLVEKSARLADEKGVELFYTVAVRLTKAAAEELVQQKGGDHRIRKLKATK